MASLLSTGPGSMSVMPFSERFRFRRIGRCCSSRLGSEEKASQWKQHNARKKHGAQIEAGESGVHLLLHSIFILMKKIWLLQF